jgi:uncharacterized protein YcfJ
MKIFTTYGPEEKGRIFVRDRGYAFTIRQTGRDTAMTNDDRNSTLRKNRYIFASAGAVLGVAAGAGMGSLAAALVGAVLGGVLGYHLLTRLGGGTKSD